MFSEISRNSSFTAATRCIDYSGQIKLGVSKEDLGGAAVGIYPHVPICDYVSTHNRLSSLYYHEEIYGCFLVWRGWSEGNGYEDGV